MKIRTERPEPETIITATMEITIDKDQIFYELPKAFEIWNIDPSYKIYRIEKKRMLQLISKEKYPIQKYKDDYGKAK